jgi:hypothetical protein
MDREAMQGLTGSAGIRVFPNGLIGTMWQDLVEGHMGIGLFHGRCAARLQGITQKTTFT